jgi:hypothetical protein
MFLSSLSSDVFFSGPMLGFVVTIGIFGGIVWFVQKS